MKNECGKMRKIDNPYEIWVAGAWEWRVLKKYKAPDSEARDPYARWHCAVSSPFTSPSHELGDVYVREITTAARKLGDQELKLALI